MTCQHYYILDPLVKRVAALEAQLLDAQIVLARMPMPPVEYRTHEWQAAYERLRKTAGGRQ